ncbi:MAG: hypothetical protein LUQ11_16690 [Methylococcaceae bacterium]|nr:hypothetical protein [Methylococcaceae bacterium]
MANSQVVEPHAGREEAVLCIELKPSTDYPGGYSQRASVSVLILDMDPQVLALAHIQPHTELPHQQPHAP